VIYIIERYGKNDSWMVEESNETNGYIWGARKSNDESQTKLWFAV
jgi:hypothetical protein